MKFVLRQSNLTFRPEKPGIISISLTLAISILKSRFRFHLHVQCVMLKMDVVRFQNSFLLEACEKFPDVEDSEGRGCVGKQLVLRTASTYQLLVKAPS